MLLSRLPGLIEVRRDRSSSDMLVTLVGLRAGAKTTRQRGKQA